MTASTAMKAPAAVNPYLETRIRTASSLELTVILYDVLLEALARGTAAARAAQVEERVLAINRAVSAITELRCALNHEQGGEIAASLDSLYAYGMARVTMAAFSNTVKELEALTQLFAPMRDAFRQAAAGNDEVEAQTAEPALAAAAP